VDDAGTTERLVGREMTEGGGMAGGNELLVAALLPGDREVWVVEGCSKFDTVGVSI